MAGNSAQTSRSRTRVARQRNRESRCYATHSKSFSSNGRSIQDGLYVLGDVCLPMKDFSTVRGGGEGVGGWFRASCFSAAACLKRPERV